MAPKRSHVDPREAYISSSMSLEDIAGLYKGLSGCSLRQLKRRSSNEKWEALRAAWRADLAAEFLDSQKDETVRLAERQLTDARTITNVGRGILASFARRVNELGGPQAFLATISDPEKLVRIGKIASDIEATGLEQERELTGPIRPPSALPVMLYQVSGDLPKQLQAGQPTRIDPKPLSGEIEGSGSGNSGNGRRNGPGSKSRKVKPRQPRRGNGR